MDVLFWMAWLDLLDKFEDVFNNLLVPISVPVFNDPSKRFNLLEINGSLQNAVDIRGIANLIY